MGHPAMGLASLHRMNRTIAALAFAASTALITSCGSTEDPTKREAFSLTVEWTSFWSNDLNECVLELAGNGVEDGPFSEGQTIELKDEAGTLLSRGQIAHIGKVSDERCAMTAKFDGVPRDRQNYVVHSSIGGTWTFLASEVESGKVSVDFEGSSNGDWLMELGANGGK